MKTIILILLVAATISPLAFADVDCSVLDGIGEKKGDIVPDFGSGRRILGKERLQFYSGPDIKCKMEGLFVIPGDTLFAHFEYAGFTKVSFIAMKKNDKPVTAWVISSRIKENGKGIVPGHLGNSE